MAKTNLTAQHLRANFFYDPDSGFLTRTTTGRGSRPGQQAGCIDCHGYRRVFFESSAYTAHRLAWLYMTGDWPSMNIDHINGRRDDNRFCNLRDVDQVTNMQNLKGPRGDNTSGFLGVSWCGARKLWQAGIRVNGKRVALGRFATAEAAHDAYLEAKRRFHRGSTL